MGRTLVLIANGMLSTVLLGGCASMPDNFVSRAALRLEESLVFHPRPYPRGDWTLDPGVEDACFQSADGIPLHGWFALAKNPRAVVLFAHGNGGNVTDLKPVLQLFRDQLNVSVLVFDYRGYGRSGGHPSEAGVLEDARAARQWLAQRAGVPESDVVLVGHSLGGGVAVDLAAKDGARGLILESTFTSLRDVGASYFPGVRWLMQTQLDSLAKIPYYRGPLLQTHGTADRVVRYALGRKLFKAANEPKQFILVPRGRHSDPPTPEYLQALDRFFDSLPASARMLDSRVR